MILQLEFSLADVMADAEHYIESKDFIGSGHFMIDKKAISEEKLKEIQSFKRLMDTVRYETIDQSRIKSVITPEYGAKFVANDLLAYTYCGEECKGVSDGKTAFNPRYYWYVTEYLGLDIHYQDKLKGREDINGGLGLFAVVKAGKVVGSIMCLNPRVVFRENSSLH